MSNYNYTNGKFTALRGADNDPDVFETEFAAIETAVATKLDTVNPVTITGNLQATGNITAQGTLNSTGNAVITGVTQANGGLTTGAAGVNSGGPIVGTTGTFSGQVTLPSGGTGNQAATVTEVTTAVAGLLPSGTKMAFFQAAAPTGWTQDVTNNDALLRVVSGAGAGTGGAGSIATGVVMPTITDGHAITISEMPAHTHTYNQPAGASFPFAGGSGVITTSSSTSTGPTGGNAAHSHTITAANWTPKYIDMIICTKN